MAEEPKDIFQETEPKPIPKIPVKSALTINEKIPSISSNSSTKRWLWLAMGALVLVVGIGVVVFFRLRQEPEATKNENRNINVNISTTTNTAPTNSVTEVTQITGAADADRDGLLDEEEKTLGTKTDLADTDRDGLGDGEEVRVYKSDPKRADTDGDGITDGVEVQKGYNPNGKGALLNFSAARQELTK